MAGSPGPQSNVENMFEVLWITDLRGEHLNHILLIDNGSAQGREDTSSGVGLLFPLGDDIIHLLGMEGRENCRERGDEAGGIESIFLQAGAEEDGIGEH